MFVLVEKLSGGIYAVKNSKDKQRVVQIFVDKDDADRYNDHLTAYSFGKELEVTPVEEEAVVRTCQGYGYLYSIIRPDDIVLPPS